MKDLHKAANLYNDAQKINTFIERYKEVTKPSNVDKCDLKFCIGNGDRFNSQPLPMYLECYKGYYGNSGCSTISLSSNSKEVQEAYVKWANKNMQLILEGISEELTLVAAEMKDSCQKEIEEAQNSFNTLFGGKL